MWLSWGALWTVYTQLFFSFNTCVWSYSSERLKRMEIMKWLTDAQAGSTNDDIQSPSGVAEVIFFQLSHCASNDFPAVSVRVLFFVFYFCQKCRWGCQYFFVVFKEGKAFKWLSKLRVMWETVLILQSNRYFNKEGKCFCLQLEIMPNVKVIYICLQSQQMTFKEFEYSIYLFVYTCLVLDKKKT